jgi:hypothetical protein
MRLPLSAASCSGVIFQNCEYPFVELALVELPGDHEFHNGVFLVIYICVLNCLTA